MSEPRAIVEARNEARRLKAEEGQSISAIYAALGGSDAPVSRATVGRWVKGIKKGDRVEPEPLPEDKPADDAGETAIDDPETAPSQLAASETPSVEDAELLRMWRRIKRRMGRDPAIQDLEHLPLRMWRLLVRLIAAIEAKLDTATLREQLGGVKILSEALRTLSEVGVGPFDRPPAQPAVAVQVNTQVNPNPAAPAYDTMPTDQLRAELEQRRQEAAKALGIRPEQLPPPGEMH